MQRDVSVPVYVCVCVRADCRMNESYDSTHDKCHMIIVYAWNAKLGEKNFIRNHISHYTSQSTYIDTQFMFNFQFHQNTMQCVRINKKMEMHRSANSVGIHFIFFELGHSTKKRIFSPDPISNAESSFYFKFFFMLQAYYSWSEYAWL